MSGKNAPDLPVDKMLATLEDIREILDRANPITIPSDFFKHESRNLDANISGRFYVDVERPFSYVIIPNVPRNLTLVGIGDEMSHRMVPVNAGETLNMQLVENGVLTVDYSAGTGIADIVDIYLSSRPIHIDKFSGIVTLLSSDAITTTPLPSENSFIHGYDPSNAIWRRIRVGETGIAVGAIQVVSPGITLTDGVEAGALIAPDGFSRAYGAYGYSFDGISGVRNRAPIIAKTVTTAALGNTALWTPAAGKKFNLFAYWITITNQATLAAAGNEVVDLRDGGTTLNLTHTAFVPAAAAPVGPGLLNTGWITLGPKGFLSAAANNVLNVNLGTALATGTCRVTCIGTEE